MTPKEKLMQGIRTVATALKNDTVTYNWSHACSCNCGLLAQALLGLERMKLNEIFVDSFPALVKNQKTWTNAVKVYCPLTGLSKVEILNNLAAAGLTAADMVHLEYLNNPAILRAAGFTSPKWYVPDQKPDYKRKEHLYRYLMGWLTILEAEPSAPHNEDHRRTNFTGALQQAIANEEYERAAELRDALTRTVLK